MPYTLRIRLFQLIVVTPRKMEKENQLKKISAIELSEQLHLMNDTLTIVTQIFVNFQIKIVLNIIFLAEWKNILDQLLYQLQY